MCSPPAPPSWSCLSKVVTGSTLKSIHIFQLYFILHALIIYFSLCMLRYGNCLQSKYSRSIYIHYQQTIVKLTYNIPFPLLGFYIQHLTYFLTTPFTLPTPLPSLSLSPPSHPPSLPLQHLQISHSSLFHLTLTMYYPPTKLYYSPLPPSCSHAYLPPPHGPPQRPLPHTLASPPSIHYLAITRSAPGPPKPRPLHLLTVNFSLSERDEGASKAATLHGRSQVGGKL